MISFIILIGYMIMFIIAQNKNNSDILSLNLLSISIPWVLYFSLIHLFQVEFYNLNIFFFIFIFFLSCLSFFLCIQGYNFSVKKNFITKKKFDRFDQYYIPLIIFGIIGASATVYERLDNFTDFLTYTNPEEIYKLRYSANLKEAGLRIESNIEYLKILFPFSFISIVPVGGSFKVKTLRYFCLFLFIFGAFMIAGRFNLLYSFMGLGIFLFLSNKKILNLKNFFMIIIFFYVLALSFTLRSPDYDSFSFYKQVAGISEMNFLGIKDLDNILLTPLYNIITYYIQSANHLTTFLIYRDLNLNELAWGSYNFEIVFNIINKIFGTTLVTKRELGVYDPTVGLFTTYTKNLLVDFGYLGCVIYACVSGFLLGYFSMKQNHHWIYRVIYYYLIIQFMVTPIMVLYNDFILLLHIFLFIILFFKKEAN